MKSSLLTTLSFILLVFTTYFQLSFIQAAAKHVEDTNGDPMYSGSKYLIWPNFFETGGQVKLDETVSSTCPLTIFQGFTNFSVGLPVKFIVPETSTDDIIYTGMELDIEFDKKPDCAESSKWVMVQDDFPSPWCGIAGTNEDDKMILDGKFKIEKHGGRFGYKLVHCPFLIRPPGTCLDVGRQNDENGRRLVMPARIDNVFEVAFFKVE